MNTRFFRCMAIALLLCPSLLYAAAINDNEDSLRIRLKNDFRRADKPSAGSGRDIYAWVQGGLIDVNTRYYSDFIGISAGAYYVYKLGGGKTAGAPATIWMGTIVLAWQSARSSLNPPIIST